MYLSRLGVVGISSRFSPNWLLDESRHCPRASCCPAINSAAAHSMSFETKRSLSGMQESACAGAGISTGYRCRFGRVFGRPRAALWIVPKPTLSSLAISLHGLPCSRSAAILAASTGSVGLPMPLQELCAGSLSGSARRVTLLATRLEWRNWQTRRTQNPMVLGTMRVRPPPPAPTPC